MARKTALGFGDDDFKRLMKIVGVGAAGLTLYRFANGRKTDALTLAGAVVTVVAFLRSV